jgi:hypothetical protein
LRPVVDVALKPTQRGRFGRHRRDSLSTGSVPLLLQSTDSAVQRGEAAKLTGRRLPGRRMMPV